MLKQAGQEKRYSFPLTSNEEFKDTKVMKKAARYAKYASAACFIDPRAIADYIGNLEPDDIKYVHAPSSGSSCPGYFIACDPETLDAVLCIRGTDSAADALADVACKK